MPKGPGKSHRKGLTLLQVADMFSDEAAAYIGIPFDHHAVKYSVREFVRGNAHTNGIESFWSLLKRGYYGRITR